MPRYDYECKKDGVFEVYQNINSPSLEHCPICYGQVKRLITAPALLIMNTRGEMVKKQKNIIDYVYKNKDKHGTDPAMKEAMVDYGRNQIKAGLVKTDAVLKR